MKSAFLSLVAALLLCLSGEAAAQSIISHPGATHEYLMSISPMVGVSAEFGAEAGVKADYLIADKAFIPAINDAVYIEGSAFVASGHAFLAPQLRWDFNLHPQWTVYGEAGIELNSNGDGRISVAAGALWRLPQKSFFLRAEVDAAHGAVRIGPLFIL